MEEARLARQAQHAAAQAAAAAPPPPPVDPEELTRTQVKQTLTKVGPARYCYACRTELVLAMGVELR
jgi:AMMECR1 domain-containing protein